VTYPHWVHERAVAGVRSSRRGRQRVLVVLALALVLAGGGLLAKREWDRIFYCSGPPSQQEQALQQAFVLAHIPDARGFEWETSDCDDEGESVLSYRTALTPAAALETFRADRACAAATWADDPDILTCKSGATRVVVGFERDGVRTSGYLGWEDRGVDP
jgi:hypothetical protein